MNVFLLRDVGKCILVYSLKTLLFPIIIFPIFFLFFHWAWFPIITYGPIDMRTTPTMVAKSGSSGGYVYEKIFSNSAQYHHQISLDSKTKKDHAMFIMSGDNTRAGEAVRTAVHSVTLNNNEPFVYLDAEI